MVQASTTVNLSCVIRGGCFISTWRKNYLSCPLHAVLWHSLMACSDCCNKHMSGCRDLILRIKYRYLSCSELVWCSGVWSMKQSLESNLYDTGSSLTVWKLLPKYCLTCSQRWAVCYLAREERQGSYTEGVLLRGTGVSSSNRYKMCGCRHSCISEVLVNLASLN